MKLNIQEYINECVNDFADAATDLGLALEAMLRINFAKPGDASKVTKNYEKADRNYTLTLKELDNAIKFVSSYYKD